MRRSLLLRRGRSRFLLRLLVPLVLTLAVVGTAQFVLLRDSVHAELVEEAQTTLRADADSIEQVLDDVNAGEVAKNDLTRYLRAIARRPGIEDATLVGTDGRNAFGNSLLGIGLPFGGPAVRAAVRSGGEWVEEGATASSSLRRSSSTASATAWSCAAIGRTSPAASTTSAARCCWCCSAASASPCRSST